MWQGLRACASLFRIDLSDTGFGSEPEVHAALEECFEANTVCHEYALHGNPVGDSAVYRWLGMVRKLPHLICLDVTNQCDPMLFKQMGDACTSNKKDWLKRQKKGKGKGKGGKVRAVSLTVHADACEDARRTPLLCRRVPCPASSPLCAPLLALSG